MTNKISMFCSLVKSQMRLFLSALLAFTLLESAGYALDIEDFTPAQNDLFNQTNFPTQLVHNTDPSFVGAGYDFSGLSYQSTSTTGNDWWVGGYALISPANFIQANHATDGPLPLTFIGSNGTVNTSSTGSGFQTGYGYPFTTPDLDVGQINTPMTQAQGVTFYPVLDLATAGSNGQTSYAAWAGQTVFLTGRGGLVNNSIYSSDGQGPRIASATISATPFVYSSSSTTGYSYFTTSQAASGTEFISGDSSGSAFIPWTDPTGQKILTVVGTNSASSDTANPATYLGQNYLSFIAADGALESIDTQMIPATGYVVQMVGNASQFWQGGPGTTFGQASSWIGAAGAAATTPGSYSYVAFDPTQSLSQTVNVASGSQARGLIFYPTAVGDKGYNLTGGDLSLGRGGIINYSTQTQSINTNISMSDSQWWIARDGDIDVTGNINLSGSNNTAQLLEVEADGSNTVTLSGVISGSNGSLAKYGTGELIVTNNNYGLGSTWQTGGSGITWIHEGEVMVEASNGLGGDYLYVDSGATLAIGAGARLGNIFVGLSDGAIVAGNGEYPNGVSIQNGMTIAPGDKTNVGTLHFDNLTLGGGGVADIKLALSNGGTGPVVADQIANTNSALQITATAADPFIIDLDSIGQKFLNLNAGQTYQWTIFDSTTQPITGFSASDFSINEANFLPGGTAWLTETPNTIVLNLTAAAPEPETWSMLLGSLVLLCGLGKLRRIRASQRA